MFERKEKNGVVFYKDSIIKTPHAFSTRLGGISQKDCLKSMNLAFNKGDDDKTVEENYRLFLSAADLSQKRAYLTQVHSKDVYYVGENSAGFAGEGDGLYTDKHGITLVIKTADCLPILLCDEKAKVIGAVHSGWKGTALGISPNCCEKMCSLGAKKENIKASIGPSIHPCCYEVKEDFIKEVTALLPSAKECIISKNGKIYADIQQMAVKSLTEIGIEPENISVSGLCTACEPELFYSHRVQGANRGTMCAAIML